MEILKEMIAHAGLLYKIAYEKTDNSHDAEDLVQETFLSTFKLIKSGKKIDNIKAFMLKVLNFKYFNYIKNKKQDSILQINSENHYFFLQEQADSTSIDDELSKTKEAIIIRKELAYLSKIYREIMVLYYMEGKNVKEISCRLNVSVDIVKKRLSRGREKIKGGIEKMEHYTDNSFSPETLMIYLYGTTGSNFEPFSVVSGMFEQNLLILAYSKPTPIEELSKKIGIPMPYVEELVDKLVRNDLMDVYNNKVQTNFLIIDDELINTKIAAQRKFVDSHFDELKSFFEDLLNEYKATDILKNFDRTQQFIYALLSLGLLRKGYLVEALNLPTKIDIPMRPNEGKWIIECGKRKKHSTSDNKQMYYYYSKTFKMGNVDNISYEIWETPHSKLPFKETDKNNLDNTIFLLYNINEKKDLEPIKLSLVPDLLKYGYLINGKNGEKIVNIPIITQDEFNTIKNINIKYTEKYIDILGQRLIDYIDKTAIINPKHIKNVSAFGKLFGISELVQTYFLKGIEEGFINIDKNKNYPISILIKNEG